MAKILIIEDHADSARLMVRILERYAHRLFHATSGEQGLYLALQEQPDLILLDLGLPDLEGQTVAALLKGQPELATIPLIAVTAWPPDTARTMAQAYGCDGFIPKPIDPKEFPQQITHYLSRRSPS